VQHFGGAELRLECYVIITKYQLMVIITIYKILKGSGCYTVAKSYQDHQGSQSEQLRTFMMF